MVELIWILLEDFLAEVGKSFFLLVEVASSSRVVL